MNETAVVTGAYSERDAPASTVAVWAVPEEVSLAKRPRDLKALSLASNPLVVVGIGIAAPEELSSVATINEPSRVVAVAARLTPPAFG